MHSHSAIELFNNLSSDLLRGKRTRIYCERKAVLLCPFLTRVLFSLVLVAILLPYPL